MALFSTIPQLAVANGKEQAGTQLSETLTLAQATFNPALMQGGQGETIDLSQFAKGNPVLPGVYRTDIYLSGRMVGRDSVEIRTDAQNGTPKICVTRALLERFNIDFSLLDRDVLARLADGDACVDIRGAIPEASATFDSAALRLDVSIPQVALRRTARGYVSPELWDKGVTSGMLGYTANVYRNVSRGSSQDSAYVGLNGSFNVGGWYFRHNGALSWYEGGSRRYDGANTYVQRDITPWQSRLTLGDAYSSGDVFDTFAFRGVRLASDDRMLPDSLRGYAPVVRGIAETNARVTIRQNGAVLYDTSVPPGPFEIDDLYPTGYGGNLDVTVTEADGRVRTFTVPYASVAQLLRPGTMRYSVVAGTVRNRSLSYTPYVVQATLQRGVTNGLTLYGGVLANEEYASVLGGAAFSTPVGAVALDVTGAQTSAAGQSLRGTSVRATYSKLITATNSNISIAAYRFSSSGFLDFNSAMIFADAAKRGLPATEVPELWRPRNRLSVTANQSLGDKWGQLYVSGYTQNYWQRNGSDTQFQVGYSNRIGIVNYTLSVSRTRVSDRSMDTQYMLSLSMPLGKTSRAPTMSINLGHGDEAGTTAQTAISGAAGEYNQYSYNAAVARNADQVYSGNVGGQYRSPFATFSGSYAQGTGYHSGSLGMTGSIVAHPGGVTATPYVSDTVAVVAAPAAAGARVGSYENLQLDARGYAVVPYLMPYRINEIALNPKGLPLDVELQTTSQQVVPHAGAIVMVKYPTVTGRPVLIKSQLSDGGSLPFGAQVFDQAGKSVGTVGQGGQIYARVNGQTEDLTVRWGDERECKIALTLPAREDGQAMKFDRVQAPCFIDTKARYLGKQRKPQQQAARSYVPDRQNQVAAVPAS